MRVSSFWNIINVFELVGYLENSVSQPRSSFFEFCEKNQTLFELWIYWIWFFDIDWNEVESELFDYTLDPVNGGYTLAQKLVSSRAYHRPMCGSRPSHGI